MLRLLDQLADLDAEDAFVVRAGGQEGFQPLAKNIARTLRLRLGKASMAIEEIISSAPGTATVKLVTSRSVSSTFGCFLSGHADPGNLAARVQLDHHRLQDTLVLNPVQQLDDEGHMTDHLGTTSL